jgi:hypothetical protein
VNILWEVLFRQAVNMDSAKKNLFCGCYFIIFRGIKALETALLKCSMAA